MSLQGGTTKQPPRNAFKAMFLHCSLPVYDEVASFLAIDIIVKHGTISPQSV
jgi:hypothetical protein